jgi:hypothetical protein
MTLVVRDHGQLAIVGNGEVIEMGDKTNVKAGAIVGSAIGTGSSVSAGGDITAEVNQTTSPDVDPISQAWG